jgi:hypothetical protein
MFKARSRSGFDNSASAQKNLDRIETRIESKERRESARRKRRFYGKEYVRDVPHLFQLFIAGKKFPRQKMMTLAHRSIANRDFEDKFSKTFDKNGDTTRKLSSWRFVDWQKYRTESSAYIEGRMIGRLARLKDSE